VLPVPIKRARATHNRAARGAPNGAIDINRNAYRIVKAIFTLETTVHIAIDTSIRQGCSQSGICQISLALVHNVLVC